MCSVSSMDSTFPTVYSDPICVPNSVVGVHPPSAYSTEVFTESVYSSGGFIFFLIISFILSPSVFWISSLLCSIDIWFVILALFFLFYKLLCICLTLIILGLIRVIHISFCLIILLFIYIPFPTIIKFRSLRRLIIMIKFRNMLMVFILIEFVHMRLVRMLFLVTIATRFLNGHVIQGVHISCIRCSILIWNFLVSLGVKLSIQVVISFLEIPLNSAICLGNGKQEQHKECNNFHLNYEFVSFSL
ncbi:unnamed protein product [Moneuplotes crassus]|uniref:Uncharacterized protein n=1 Tax=Euplotes crassus TaxID=5936 RepID=A0AAD1XUN4_EUPCR|nr:unnamed protein product [Moneuplotes crassus]